MPHEVIEYRCWGPPGTGKTHYVQELAAEVIGKYGPDSALIVSFTKTAAQEIIRRIGNDNGEVNREQVGTLHAVAYRALNRPVIAETRLKEFGEEHPEWSLTAIGSGVDLDDPYSDEPRTQSSGDTALDALNLLRARCVPPELWPASVRRFASVWSAWKEVRGFLDFTDLIDVCRRDVECAPGNPQIGILDEAQDTSKLQMALLRSWARHMQYLMVTGDADQSIFEWAGANPRDFFETPVPPERRKILAESHRVPRAVHAVACAWRQRMTQREEGEYYPRDAEGEVRHIPASFRAPERMVEAIRPYVDEGKTVMILTSCSYMLQPILAALREAGLPFANTFRPRRSDWNPLEASNGLSAAQRLAVFLRGDPRLYGDEARMWTKQEIYQWGKVLRAEGVFVRGQRTLLDNWKDSNVPATLDDLYTMFTPEVADDLLFSADLDWYVSRLAPKKTEAMAYPLRIIEARGLPALLETPRITVGTIHSSKGGQADVVVVCPDLSRAGMREWTTMGAPRDSVLRVFYVGITRARETLLLAQAASPWAVNW